MPGWFHPPCQSLLLKCGKGGFHLSEALLQWRSVFPACSATAVTASCTSFRRASSLSLFAAQNGFHLFGQGGEHGFRQVFKFQLNRRCH